MNRRYITIAAFRAWFGACFTLAIWAGANPALHAQGTSNEKELQKLLKNLHNKDGDVREEAALGLADFPNMDKYADQAIPVLLNALKYTDNIGVGTISQFGGDSLREIVVDALKNAGPEGMKALKEKGIDLMIKNLDKEPPGSQYHTVMLLSNLGPIAEKAVPQVVKLTKSNNKSVQREAIEALADMGPAATAALVEMAKKGGADMKIAVFYPYRWKQELPKAMIPLAIELLDHANAKVPYQATRPIIFPVFLALSIAILNP